MRTFFVWSDIVNLSSPAGDRGLNKKIIVLLFCILFFAPSFSQKTQFSLATDFTVLRSFKKEQRFWTIGQTVAGHFNFSPKDGLFILFSYSGNGEFSNRATATAKSILTIPQQVDYTNDGVMRFRHISIGWKRYLKGIYNSEENWNLYSYAGFGLMLGRIENTHSVAVDSAGYLIPVLAGKANFKRLTLDLGFGCERPVGGDVFFYLEARALIPTTDYPSNYLFINKDAPLMGSVNIGLRILFD
ncbi:MAG: hypothetical protein ACXWV6_07075 [Chitinophagaceae bacterium]